MHQPRQPENISFTEQVSELRARLKATSAAFQTREKSLAELREAVVELEQDRRAGQEKFRAQSRKLEDQVPIAVDCPCLCVLYKPGVLRIEGLG